MNEFISSFRDILILLQL